MPNRMEMVNVDPAGEMGSPAAFWIGHDAIDSDRSGRDA